MIFPKWFDPTLFNKGLRFAYTNWRGDRHWYVVIPEVVKVQQYNPVPAGKTEMAALNFVLHAHVVTRDDEVRPGRRTFMISEMRQIEVIDLNPEAGQPHTGEMSYELWS